MSHIAGSRRPPREPGLVVDYADVLRQAVENERAMVVREVLRKVRAIPDTKPQSGSSYRSDDRGGAAVKRDVLAVLAAMEMDR